jgi:hypothetical protein
VAFARSASFEGRMRELSTRVLDSRAKRGAKGCVCWCPGRIGLVLSALSIGCRFFCFVIRGLLWVHWDLHISLYTDEALPRQFFFFFFFL